MNYKIFMYFIYLFIYYFQPNLQAQRSPKRFDPIGDKITNPFLLYTHRLRRRLPGYPSKVVLQIAG